MTGGGGPEARTPLATAALAGAGAAVLGVAIMALASPGLYVEMAAFAAVIAVVPLTALAAALAAFAVLRLRRRLARGALPTALAAGLVAGEVVFLASLGTPFARWSAARYWAAAERQAAGERAATDREVCRKLLAERPIPPPPAPPGATANRGGAGGIGPPRAGTGSLLAYDRERCAELLRGGGER